MLPVTLESCTKMMSPGPSTSPRPPAPLSGVKELNGAVDVPSPPGAAEPFTYQIIGLKVRLTVPVALAGAPHAGASVTVYWKVALPTPAAGTKLNEPLALRCSVPLAKVQSNGATVSAQPTTPVMEMGSPSTVSASLSSTPLPEAVVRTTFGVVFAGRSTRSPVLPQPLKLSFPAVGGPLT